MITVLGAAEPMPIVRHLSGPVVTIESALVDGAENTFLEGCWPRKDVGWKANALPAMRRYAADDSFIVEIFVIFLCI